MSVPDTDTNSPVTIPTTTTDRPAGTGQASDVAGIPTVARHRPFGLVLLITGVVGWVASAILVLERLELYEDAGYITSCDINPWVSCGKVMGTWQSELFGLSLIHI